MNPQLRELFEIVDHGKATVAAADLHELSLPAGLEACESAKAYLAAVPAQTLEVGYFRLLGPEGIRDHNQNHIPSYHCTPFGLVTIATNQSGDAASLDLATGHVFLLSHEKFEEDGLHLGWNEEKTGFLPVVSYSKEAIMDSSDGFWDDVTVFLSDLVEGYKNEKKGA